VTVLVVDDDPGFRELARLLLADLGLPVAGEAGTVAEARAAMWRLRTGAALVDVGLPDGDGVEFAAELSELAWRPRIVLVSSDPDVITPEEARAAGAAGFLAKTDLPSDALRAWLLQ